LELEGGGGGKKRRENIAREREIRGLRHLFFIEQFFGSSSSVISIARHATARAEQRRKE
jgi:hypothetical protein